MASQEAGESSPPLVKSEPDEGPNEPATDAPPQASAENPSLAGLSVKVSDSSKPREAFNREMYRIPSYAGWFSWGKIHTIERRALPEFFDGYSLSKTPKVYKEYREFIINKYRENPRRVLTFTEVRKMLVGDVNLLRKVFDFLEYWGLINYHVENKQQQTIASGDKSPSDSSLSNVKQKEMVAERMAMARLESNATALSETITQGVSGSALSPFQAGPLAVRSLDQPLSTSQATDILSQKDVFASSATTSSPEGIIDPAKDNDWLGNWTMEEVLRLLEAIGKFGEDWYRVAAHVGTKSKLDCVLRFIKLPFGDQFTSNIGASPNSVSNSKAIESRSQLGGDEHKSNYLSTSSLDGNGANEQFGSDEVIDEPPSKKNRLAPFADSSNPILAQVAFLSAMVGPRVAAAAAQAAVSALAEDDPVFFQAMHTGANTHNAQVGSKDIGALSGSQATSLKADDAEGEDVPPRKGHEVQGPKDVETTSGSHARAGMGVAIGTVAANTKLLADQEERDIEHIIASIIESQLRKLQSKVEHYEELELILEKEHAQLEKARLQVLGDWIRYSQYHYNAGPA